MIYFLGTMEKLSIKKIITEFIVLSNIFLIHPLSSIILKRSLKTENEVKK